MMARFIFLSFFMLVGALAPTKAQNSFPYPALPDSLRSVEQRATYLSEHYWDNFNFSDTLELANKEMAEQGFVNFIDILARFDQEIAQKGIAAFTAKAYQQKPSKEKFESLIEHYYENPESPMRNDRVYALFLEDMAKSPYFDVTEKERIEFKLKQAKKNLPGTQATNISFMLEDGKPHQLSDYRGKKVICGGTTAHIIARELNRKVYGDDGQSRKSNLPTSARMDGADLVTEGILTLGHLADLIQSQGDGETPDNSPSGEILKIVAESDIIEFLVGTKINEAHYDPSLPVELEIRRNLIRRLKVLLEEKMMKKVTVKYI